MATDPQAPDTGGLLGFFGRGYDPAAAYGGLLSDPATQDAMKARALAAMAGAFAEGAMPVPYKGGIPFAATLGKAGAAAYAGEDALIKARTEAAQQALYGAQAGTAQQSLAALKAAMPLIPIALGQGAGAGAGGGAGDTSAAPLTGPAKIIAGGAKGNIFDTGDPFLNLVAYHESKYDPNVGTGEHDLSNYQLDPTGFPAWPGISTPKGNSTAAGLFQITGQNWHKFAPPLIAAGVIKPDFSVDSQIAVAKAMKAVNGTSDWLPYNAPLAAAHARGDIIKVPGSPASTEAVAPAGPGGPPPGLLAEVPNFAAQLGGAPPEPGATPGPAAAAAPPLPVQPIRYNSRGEPYRPLAPEEAVPAGTPGAGPVITPAQARAANVGGGGLPVMPSDFVFGPGKVAPPGAGAVGPAPAPVPPGPQGGLLGPPPGLAPGGPPSQLATRSGGLLTGGGLPPVAPAGAGGDVTVGGPVASAEIPPAAPAPAAPNLTGVGGLLKQPPGPVPGLPPPPIAPPPSAGLRLPPLVAGGGAPPAGPAPVGPSAAPAMPPGAPPPGLPPGMPGGAAPTAIPGAPSQEQIRAAQGVEAAFGIAHLPVPSAIATIAKFPFIQPSAQAAAAGTALGQEPIKQAWALWFDQNKMQTLRRGGVIRNPVTGEVTSNPDQIKLSDPKTGAETIYNLYPSIIPGVPSRLEPIGQGALGPGQTAGLTGAAQTAVKAAEGVHTAAAAATDAYTTISLARSLIPGAYTGPGAAYANEFNDILVRLGIGTPQLAAKVADWTTLQSNLQEALRTQLKGETGEGFTQVAKQMGDVRTSPEGLDRILAQMQGVADYRQAKEQAMKIYADARGGGDANTEGFAEDWNKRMSPYPFMVTRLAPKDQAALFDRLHSQPGGQKEVDRIVSQWKYAKANNLMPGG